DDELVHHGVLGGGVGAAGGVGHFTTAVEAVVVAGHDPVEVVGPVLTCAAGVVVDHVHDGAQTEPVESGDHFAHLQRAVRALGVGGVGPLGDGEVLGDISPVEAVLGCDLGDAFLLLVTVRGKGGQVAFGGFVVLAVLRFHAEVRHG